ncbi:Lactonase, 7-bladed beta-propeller-domain-containing protein [Xylaria palmicola]|nr:Lactonase, 7-bladed beta-propeller-domain-containing protein [Xylaria palmicola]
MLPTVTAFLAIGGLAIAAPATMRDVPSSRSDLLLVGGPKLIRSYEFNGKDFVQKANIAADGTDYSWMRYRASSKSFFATNENGKDISEWSLNTADGSIPPAATTSVDGSSGVVFLEFNKDQTRMVSAAYGSGAIDVLDTTKPAAITLIKSVNITTGTLGEGQAGHHPHQAILDPTGEFMVVPDLGADQLLVLDIKDEKYEFTNTVTLDAGSGPRHGGFIKAGDKTFFFVATELSNMVAHYEVAYGNKDTGLEFNYINTQSTYGPNAAPKNATSAAAGAILIAGNGKDIYVSNRLTGDEEDNIAHFTFDAETRELTHVANTPSGGLGPRSISLSADDKQSLLFVANQGGKNAISAFSRCSSSGSLVSTAIASLSADDFGVDKSAPMTGPQFVAAIPK